MKKFLLSVGVVLTSISLNAQSILNGGFETWGAGATSNQVPANWTWFSNLDPNIITNPAIGGTVTAGGTAAVPVVKGTSGAPEGAAYVKLTSCTRAGSLNPSLDGIYGGTILQVAATTAQPASFSFKYKYDGKNSDSALVAIQATKWNTATLTSDLVGQGLKVIKSNTATWTNVTNLPIQWAAVPDTITIYITSSYGDFIMGGVVIDNSILEVDALSYGSSASSASLEENISGSVVVYPNPATDILNIKMDEEIASVVITSVDGKVVSKGNNGTVGVSDLNAGVYVYEVTSVTGKIAKGNFIKQ